MLSKKQEAISEFFRSAGELRRLSRNWPDQSLAKVTDSIINATSIFGESEYFAREAERCNILGIQKDRENNCKEMLKKRNSDGLKVLSGISESINQLKKQSKSIKVASTEKLKEQLEEFSVNFADILVDSNLKPSDVSKVYKVAEEIVAVAMKKGADGIASFLNTKFEEYEQVRNRKDRGAIDNIPIWKLSAVALILGIAVIAVIHCTTIGCRGSEGSYAGAFLVLALIAVFC